MSRISSQSWLRILVFVQISALLPLGVYSWWNGGAGATYEGMALPLLAVYPPCCFAVLVFANKELKMFLPVLVVEGALGVAFFLAFLPLVQ